MTLLPKILAKKKGSTEVVPKGVSFDGETDYLSRSSDLVGNVDSKTFTFSCVLYGQETSLSDEYMYGISDGSTNSLSISYVMARDSLNINGYNSSGTKIFQVSYTVGYMALYTYNLVQLSVDLSDVNKKHLYVNDKEAIGVFWSIYTDDLINFSNTEHTIGRVRRNISAGYKGRLSNVFLDYTYRDLSIEANRRLFITEDGLPAEGLESLNPILYLPMDNAETAHVNLGTGGDFVQNGILADVDVGANQVQCKASEFDGVDDYLSSTNIGASDSKLLTLSTIIKPSAAGNKYILGSPSNYVEIRIFDNNLTFTLRNSALSTVLNITGVTFPYGREASLDISFDLSDAGKRHFLIDGVEQNPTYATYVNDFIKLATNSINIGAAGSGAETPWDALGEFYFDTVYMPLDIYNPFWIED